MSREGTIYGKKNSFCKTSLTDSHKAIFNLSYRLLPIQDILEEPSWPKLQQVCWPRRPCSTKYFYVLMGVRCSLNHTREQITTSHRRSPHNRLLSKPGIFFFFRRWHNLHHPARTAYKMVYQVFETTHRSHLERGIQQKNLPELVR